MTYIIKTKTGRKWVNLGEGPFESKEEAERFASAEVGVAYRIAPARTHIDTLEIRAKRNARAPIVRKARALIVAYCEADKANKVEHLAQIMKLGNELAIELVAGVDGLDHLISKHAAHGYRPTLRGDIGPRYIALADLYDFRAALSGLSARAYRG